MTSVSDGWVLSGKGLKAEKKVGRKKRSSVTRRKQYINIQTISIITSNVNAIKI